MNLPTVAVAAWLLVLPACASAQTAARGGGEDPPATPAPVEAVLVAQPFTLETPYRYEWSRERPLVSRGVLVVLAVDPALVVRRDALQPVLYAGDVPVQRLNHGDRSGRVVGIVPSVDDLAGVPIWFGAPQLPERVDAGVGREERARAGRAGLQPVDAAELEAVERPPVAARHLAELLREVAAGLVEQYAPEDGELAAAWRMPTAGGSREPQR